MSLKTAGGAGWLYDSAVTLTFRGLSLRLSTHLRALHFGVQTPHLISSELYAPPSWHLAGMDCQVAALISSGMIHRSGSSVWSVYFATLDPVAASRLVARAFVGVNHWAPTSQVVAPSAAFQTLPWFLVQPCCAPPPAGKEMMRHPLLLLPSLSKPGPRGQHAGRRRATPTEVPLLITVSTIWADETFSFSRQYSRVRER